MTHTDSGDIIIDYKQTTSINPHLLINEVRKHEILYNNTLADFGDTPKKEQIWERIHSVIFPNYKTLSQKTKKIIKSTVRKRWKSLRDALVKDHRHRTEDPVYRTKMMSAQVKELQFLIPYIRYSRELINAPTIEKQVMRTGRRTNSQRCKNYRAKKRVIPKTRAEQRDQLQNIKQPKSEIQRSREYRERKKTKNQVGNQNGNTSDQMDAFEATEVSNNYTIEHTDSYDILNAYSSEDEPIVTYDSSLSYEVQDAISITSKRSSIEEYFDEGEQCQSQGVTIPEGNFYEERELVSKRNFNDLQEEKSEQEEASPPTKRSKLEIEEDINQTVLEILQQSSMNAKDEDRMFFLSLLSDFKRIPIKKKLQVKSKILTAISDALQ